MGRGWVIWTALAGPLLAVAVVSPSQARAEDQGQGQGWETIARGAITVKVRTLRGTAQREVWAEGELDAEVQDLQSAILDADAYPRFMPYVKEARVLETTSEGARLVYSRLEPPFIGARDYVVKVQVQKRADAEGRGDFANAWHAVPDRVPKRDSVVRLPVCEGSWKVSRAASGRSKVVYRASVDPGGWMPGFLSDVANRNGAIGTMRAVEREAQRRGVERKAQAANEVRPRRGTPSSTP